MAGALACLWAMGAQAQCRLALALALDVSGSVNAQEYRLQLDGLARALMRPAVRTALLSAPGQPVALLVYEWSGPGYQRGLVPWTLVTDIETLGRIASRLQATERAVAPTETGLGTAVLHGAAMLRQGPSCAEMTVDVSGDGENNTGPRPQDAIVRGALAGITVNGLVIGEAGTSAKQGDSPRLTGIDQLEAYFRANVLHGPFAFVEKAQGFTDYEDAMARKLLKEVQSMVLGQVDR